MLAAGLASSMAQPVYSLNVVGYYNIQCTANTWYLIGNQLKTTNDVLSVVIPSAPDGSSFQKFSGGYSAYTFDTLEDPPAWVGGPPDANAQTLAPGEGGFFKSPVDTTLTFVGEVPQGSLTNTLPIGLFVIRASAVPQAGTPDELGIPGEDGDGLQLYRGGYSAFTFDTLEDPPAWVGAGAPPTIGVGEAFFYRKAPTSSQSEWVRDFTVPE
jgi:hypothetical protein